MKRDDRPSSDLLKGFVPRPAPPELRSRVLSAARAVRLAAGFWSPIQWAAAVGCGLSIVVLLAAGARLAHRLSGRMDVLLAGTRGAAAAVEAVSPELREAVGVALADRSWHRPAPERPRPVQREVLDWESVEEDVDAGTKNPR